MSSVLPINCPVCGRLVASDASTCPNCGTLDVSTPISGPVALAAIGAVALLAWLLYVAIFRTSQPLPSFPALTASESQLFAQCAAAIRRVDPQAIVLPRPDVDRGSGLHVSWPYDGDGLVVDGMRTSGVCVVGADGRLQVLSIHGKDLI